MTDISQTLIVLLLDLGGVRGFLLWWNFEQIYACASLYKAVEQQLTELRNSLPKDSPSSPESSETSQKESSNAIFQAIGVLKAKFVVDTVINNA